MGSQLTICSLLARVWQVARRIPSGYTAACISHDGSRGDDEDGGGGGGKHGTQTRCYVLRPTQVWRCVVLHGSHSVSP